MCPIHLVSFLLYYGRDRTSFTGALTNGALWRFFTAHDGGNEIRIYTSQEFASDTDNGVIVELLKDMVYAQLTIQPSIH